MKYLENMPVEKAEKAAAKIYSIVKELGEENAKGGVDLSSVAGAIIPAVAKGLSDEKNKALAKVSIDPEI